MAPDEDENLILKFIKSLSWIPGMLVKVSVSDRGNPMLCSPFPPQTGGAQVIIRMQVAVTPTATHRRAITIRPNPPTPPSLLYARIFFHRSQMFCAITPDAISSSFSVSHSALSLLFLRPWKTRFVRRIILLTLLFLVAVLPPFCLVV